METDITKLYEKHKAGRLLILSLIYERSGLNINKTVDYKKILDDANIEENLIIPIIDWLLSECYIVVASNNETKIIFISITHEGIKAVEDSIIVQTQKPSLVNFMRNRFLI